MKKTNQKYIVRGNNSGVFFGEIKSRTGQEVTMKNTRRIWHWDGAASVSQLAVYGTNKPDECKFTISVDEIVILDAIEIIPCTDKAAKSINEVAVWTV